MDRRLDREERALWSRVIATVKPLHIRSVPVRSVTKELAVVHEPTPAKVKGRVPSARPAHPAPAPPVLRSDGGLADGGLDGSWDRRVNKGQLQPDIQIDLHGMNMALAHARLDGVLEQAIHSGMRTILLVTGKLRDHDRASGKGRGAIRAAVDDWLHASRHARSIAAVRQAHPRHGGDGALYIILRRGR